MTVAPMQSVSVTQPVFLVRQPARMHPATWLAVHDMARLSNISCTRVLAFAKRDHACMCARNMEDYHTRHGHYPSREYTRKPRRLDWVRATTDPPRMLEVVGMSLAEVTTMVKGTGMHVTIVSNPYSFRNNIDIVIPFDKALACARLNHAFKHM